MTKRKTAAELAKSRGTNRSYLFMAKRIKENPKLDAAVKAGRLPLYIARKLVDCDVVTQNYVLDVKTSKEARARFGEVQAELYKRLAGETLELRQLRKAWEKCSDEDRQKFMEDLLDTEWLNRNEYDLLQVNSE
jgi:hypothetical protein